METHLTISKSVTQEEWEKVYEETLSLAEKFPFVYGRIVKLHGIETFCLFPTQEYEETYGWHDEYTRKGWSACGDNVFLKTAEQYYLPRNLVDESFNPDAVDTILGSAASYFGGESDEAYESHAYHLWGAKTQGRLYHFYLLAIASLIEARLGEKAFTYGNITRGQLRKAVRILNQYLDEPVELPDRCFMDLMIGKIFLII